MRWVLVFAIGCGSAAQDARQTVDASTDPIAEPATTVPDAARDVPAQVDSPADVPRETAEGWSCRADPRVCLCGHYGAPDFDGGIVTTCPRELGCCFLQTTRELGAVWCSCRPTDAGACQTDVEGFTVVPTCP